MNAATSMAPNRPFPLMSPVAPGHSGSALFFLAGGGLCLAAFCPKPAPEMVSCWSGGLSYGVFVHDGVPFLVVFFRDGRLSLNPGVNLLSEVEAGRPAYREFLAGEANELSLVLVDSVSNHVSATRRVNLSYPAAYLLRETCRKQLSLGSAVEVCGRMWETLETCDAETMILLSQVHENVPGLNCSVHEYSAKYLL